MTACIELKEVTKKYKDNVVLNNITAKFEKGKIHGIIGRNGSGKTVLFKCICGFVPLSKGNIRIFSEPVKCFSAQNIGIILEEPGFLTGKSAYTNLKLLADITLKHTNKELSDILDMVGLDPDSKKPVGKFSLGMRHRLAIAQAIVDNPPLLVLDEPMNGLDQDGVREIKTVLKKLVSEGVTILMSSHYVDDLKNLCDVMWEMNAGTLSML